MSPTDIFRQTKRRYDVLEPHEAEGLRLIPGLHYPVLLTVTSSIMRKSRVGKGEKHPFLFGIMQVFTCEHVQYQGKGCGREVFIFRSTFVPFLDCWIQSTREVEGRE